MKRPWLWVWIIYSIGAGSLIWGFVSFPSGWVWGEFVFWLLAVCFSCACWLYTCRPLSNGASPPWAGPFGARVARRVYGRSPLARR